MPYNSLIFITFLFIFLPSTYASEWPAYEHGIAMHGEEREAPTTPHLDYVNPDAPKGGHLKMAASKGTFDTLNPFALKGTAAEGLNLVYDRLMARRWNEPFTMHPMIARSISVPEDRSAITFHLNPAAKFNDGTPITADDVEFSFNTLKEHGRPNMRRIYKLVKEVKKHDKHSITFSFGEGYDRETVMILTLMPVLSKAYWQDRDFEATLLEPPVTNGPYKIESLDQGRSITYVRNPDYWAKDLYANIGHYNFERVTYEYFRDDSVALEAFNKGDLNYRFENAIGKWIKGYLDKPDTIKYEAPHQRPERVRGFIFNTRHPFFADKNVRTALSLAFDEKWVKEYLFYGKAKRTDGFFANSILSANHGIKKIEKKASLRSNLKLANNILEQSGWTIENGKRVKDGKPLEFEIILNTYDEEKIALNWKKHLQRLGVTINIRVLDPASFQKRRQDYDFDMIAHYWQNSLSPGTEQMLYWTCEAAQTPGQFNYSGICDSEIDTLAAKIADAKTYNELTKLTRTLDQKLQDQNMIIPLFHNGKDHIAHHSTLKHPDTPPLYGSVVETWWMDEDKGQKQD